MIDSYAENVSRLADGCVDLRFSNKGPQHAGIVVSALFLKASSSVRIFTGSFCSDFYFSEPVLSALNNFLSKSDVSLSILHSDDIDSRVDEFFKSYSHSGRVIIRSLDKDISGMDKHFMVIDSTGYRLEINHGSREAVVNFNEPEFAQKLGSLFDRYF